MLSVKSLSTKAPAVASMATRAFSMEAYLPRITDRRIGEQGPGGRSSNAGLKFAIFGATGFLGKHVCNQLGTWMFPIETCRENLRVDDRQTMRVIRWWSNLLLTLKT